MNTPLAERVRAMQAFLVMEVMERAYAMEADGAQIAHLEVGEPDFEPPSVVVEACQRALRRGETRYTDSRGLLELRRAVTRDCRRRFGVEVDPDRVFITGGTSPAMLVTFSVLIEPGDEIVLGAPCYPCYPNFIRYCGGVPVFIATDPGESYRLDPEAVRRALTPRTRAIVVSSPANPTGAIQSREDLRVLAELGPTLVSDEIYDGLVYDGARVTSALELSDQAFVLDGFSKRYAMTGFRLGYVIAPEWAGRPLQIMLQNLFISANRFVQHAGIAALEHGAEAVEAMRSTYQRRREVLVEGLRRLGFGIPHLPRGAFYVLADARRFGSDSRRLAFKLLERARVGVTPGIDFGPAGEGMLRFCYAASEATIERALERLERVLPGVEAEARRVGGAGEAAAEGDGAASESPGAEE